MFEKGITTMMIAPPVTMGPVIMLVVGALTEVVGLTDPTTATTKRLIKAQIMTFATTFRHETSAIALTNASTTGRPMKISDTLSMTPCMVPLG